MWERAGEEERRSPHFTAFKLRVSCFFPLFSSTVAIYLLFIILFFVIVL